MSLNYTIDNLDQQILNILMKDGKVSYAEIGKKLYVSPGTVHVRVKKMEQAKVIDSTQLKVNYLQLGYRLVCFVGLFLKESSQYDAVNAELEKLNEIVEIHYTTGTYSLFLKMVLRDSQHLMEMLHDKIQPIEGIQRTETLISLKESVHRPLEIDIHSTT